MVFLDLAMGNDFKLFPTKLVRFREIASYSQGATVAIFVAQNHQFGDFLNENLQSGINHR